MRAIIIQPMERRAPAEDIAHAAELIGASGLVPSPSDLLILPELIGRELATDVYESCVCGLARTLGLHVVGGSHHGRRGNDLINEGVVSDPDGCIIARYAKTEPYHRERELGVVGGAGAAFFAIGEARICAMICSDFWRTGTFGGSSPPSHLVAVPAFSVTQRPTPEIARAVAPRGSGAGL